jgi:predicted unusual protein kinase regulating ubiquinone biosynthesis (AarF/ABC1/UbiB family)
MRWFFSSLWKTAQPLLRQWARERWSAQNLLKETRDQLPDFVQALTQLPPLIENAIQRASDGRLQFQVEASNLDNFKDELRESARKRDVTIVSALTALGGILWLAVSGDPPWIGAALVVGGAGGLLFRR